MIYLVETYQMSGEARGNPAFPEWLQKFNALVLEKNPTVESVDMYVLFSGPPSRDRDMVWHAQLRRARSKC
jgi:hypothetical protein